MSAAVAPAERVALAYARQPTGQPRWEQRARCREADPELFWPPPDEPADEALALCVACPVLGDCRELFGAQPRDEGGVWFATAPDERARQRSTRGRAA